MNSNFLNKLSKHIFWDADINTIDVEKNAVFIMQRVIQYGLLKDWQIIKSEMGIDKIKKYAVQIPSIDPISLSFLSNLLNIDKSQFKCYKSRQLNPNFWSY
jgi:hypothetical protein